MVNIAKKPTDIESSLICPNCSQTLKRSKDEFICTNCDTVYPSINDIPFLVKNINKHKYAEAEYHSSISHIYRQLHHLTSYCNIYYHLQSLKPILGLAPCSTVLELGCGTGYDALFLLKKGLFVVETDISTGQLTEAKKRLKTERLSRNTLFYAADAENIPFADRSFNATFITAALHHLEHPARSLSEIKRCTKRGGIIIIAMEPNRYEWIVVFGYLFSIFKRVIFKLFGENLFKTTLKKTEKLREPDVERTFSKREILSLLKQAGLHPKRIKSIWFICGFIHWFITLLTKISNKPWYINRDIERILISIDEVLSHLPLINQFCCNWTVECRKE